MGSAGVDVGDRLFGAELVDDPYPFYARLRADAPVWPVPRTHAFFVSTWDLVAEAAGRYDDFSNHFRHSLYAEEDGSVGVMAFDAGTDVFAGADPPDHTAHRRLFFPELLQKKLGGLEGVVTALADELLDPLLADGGGDVTTALANVLPLQVVADHVIGFRDADVELTQRWVLGGARLMGGRLRLDEMGPAMDDAAGMMPWVAAQLDDALSSSSSGTPRSGDVLSAAAAGVRSGLLTHDQATFALMVLMGAGGETTTSLIGNAIRMLAERADVQSMLRADPSSVAAFVEEALRVESPFRFHPRTATRDTELGGVAIPAGALVALLWGSANRDDAVFDAPDEVVVGRPTVARHVAFGRGIHHCVGAALARLEGRVVLSRLLARTRSIALDRSSPPRWVDSLWVRRHERLDVVLTPA